MQVQAFINGLDGDHGPFSAKAVYDRLNHPARHDFKTSIGTINKLLHQAWSEGRLISYADETGTLLREEQFVAPGSAAVEHPQVFAALDTPSPKTGYIPVSYADHHNRPAAAGTNGSGDAAQAGRDDVRDDGVEELNDGELEELADDISERLWTSHTDVPAPAWLPEPLLREWMTRPHVVKFLRDGLDQATQTERRQLILTGIGRKGTITPDSAAAAALARLCSTYPVWWGRCANWALRDYSHDDRTLSLEHLTGLPGNLDDLLDDYDPEVIVLTCLRLGFDGDEVRVLAGEAADALGKTTVATLDEEMNSLRARLELAETETRDVQKQLKEERQKRRSLEQAADTRTRELEKLRALTVKAGDAAGQLAELQRELVQARSELAARTAERDSAREDADRASELEAQLGAAEAGLATSQDALTAAQAQVARGRAGEQELQQALRTIGELNVRIAELEGAVGNLPVLDDARSLVQLLDGAIGSLVADAAERIRAGEAREDDRQLLAFAAQFVDFKSGLASAPPAAPQAPLPAAEEAEEVPELDAAAVEEGDRKAAVARRVRTRLGWTVKPLGGAGEIGASAILATTPSGRSVLLDAGQRVRGVYGSSSNDYDFHYGVAGVDELAAILVSHAHIDHTGSLPVLHRNQSAQQQRPIPVYASEPTIELAEIMMADSAKI